MGSERDWKWNTGVSPSSSPPSSPPASPPASPTASPASSGTSGKTSPSSRARPLTGLMFSAAIAGAGLSRHSGLAAILAAGVTVITMSTPALAAGYISSATVEGAVDCEVAWGSQYTPCSKEGLQSRRYSVTTYPTLTGYQCPIGADTRTCSYPGVTTHPVDGDQGSWGAPVCVGDACEFATIRATVGDKLIFKYPAGQGSVFRLPTAHHYAECVFGDGGVRLAGPDDGASEGGFVYEIAERDRNSELLVRLVPGHAPYPKLAAEGDACSKGQKIRVVVDDFQPATLSEVVSLVTSGTYRSEEEAQHLIARLWSLEAGCPTSSLGFYQGDAERAALRCRADAMSMLGFVFRKRPAADVARSEAYYNRALELHPGHCEAWSYKGMLMLDHGSLSDAVSAYNSLADLAESTAAQGAGVAALSPHPDAHICRDALVALQDKWHEKGWCFPPNQKASPCDGYSAAARVSGFGLAVLMTLPLLLLVRPV